MSWLEYQRSGDQPAWLLEAEVRLNGEAKHVIFARGYGQLKRVHFSAIAISVSVMSSLSSMLEYALSS